MLVATAERPGFTVRADVARCGATRAGLAVDPRPVEATRGAVPRAEREVVLVPDDVAPAAEAVAGCDAPAGRDESVDGELECEPVGSPPPSGVVTVGTGSDGVVVGVLMPGVLTPGVVTVTLVTDGTVTGTVVEGTVADGTLTDGRLTDGRLTDGTVTTVDGTLPSATAADAPAAATSPPHATSEALRVQLLTPAPRTASQPKTLSTLTND